MIKEKIYKQAIILFVFISVVFGIAADETGDCIQGFSLLPVTTVAVQMESENGFCRDVTLNPLLLAGVGLAYNINWKSRDGYYLGFTIKSIFDIDIAFFQLYNPYSLAAASISAVSYFTGILPGVIYVKLMQRGALIGVENSMTLSQFFGNKDFSKMAVFEPGVLFSFKSLILNPDANFSISSGPYLFCGYGKIWSGWDKGLSKYVEKSYVIGGFLGSSIGMSCQRDTVQQTVSIFVGVEYRTGLLF